MREVDTAPVQLMVGTTAIFNEYNLERLVCRVIYGRFLLDLYEIDEKLSVHHYDRISLVKDDGYSLRFNDDGVKTLVAILLNWLIS